MSILVEVKQANISRGYKFSHFCKARATFIYFSCFFFFFLKHGQDVYVIATNDVTSDVFCRQ